MDTDTGPSLTRLSQYVERPIYHVEDQEEDGKQYVRKFVRAECFMTPFAVRGAVDIVPGLQDVFSSMFGDTELQGHIETR